MDELFNIEGLSVVITGSAGVLCGHMAASLAQRGAKVCIVDYDAKGAEKMAESIKTDGNFATWVQTNVLDKEQVENALSHAVQTMGKVDALINGAGGNKKDATSSPPREFFDLPDDAIRAVFDLNCMGTIIPSQVFGKHIAEHGKGCIINITSMNALRPLTNIAAYSAAKAAIANFTQWLSTYMTQRHSADIRVNSIAPGFFLTEQNRFLLTDEATGELTTRGNTIIEHTPMKRFGQPQDLTGTVTWLLSEASKFVSGIVVPVDGGFSAFSGV